MIIRNGRIALPDKNELVTANILIREGIIAEIGPCLEGSPQETGQEIDASGLVVLPGGIDPHVHFDDPGYTQREDFYSGSCAAASGGVTTVIDMPCTSLPPVTNKKNMLAKLKVIESKAIVDFGLFGGVSSQSFEEGFPGYMDELSGHVLGFKTYFISGMQVFERLNHYQFKEVLETARTLGLPVLLHAEDYDYTEAATKEAAARGKGPIDYYLSRPEIAEILAVTAALELAEETDANLHLVHVGTAKAVEFIRERAGRSFITCETAPHYLQFDIGDFERLGSHLKVTPPVKSPANRQALWELLAQGAIDFLASDHAPSSFKEKNTGSIWSDYSGIPGCGTLLPYIFSEGYLAGRIDLKRLVEITSANAARRYGLFNRKGSLEVGKDADLVIIDPGQEWVVEGSKFHSQGKITPFEGLKLRGRIEKSILRGKTIYDRQNGILAQKGYGHLLCK